MSANTNGLHFSANELDVWRQRAAYGPYRTKGDADTGTPGDYTRITNYRTWTLANVMAKGPRYSGHKNRSDTTFSLWTGYPNGFSFLAHSYDSLPVWQGVKLLGTAFYALVDSNNATADSVKKALLAQASYTKFPRAKGSVRFNALAASGAGDAGFRNGFSNGHPEAAWILRLLFAYDYVKSRFDSTEADSMQAFFRPWAVCFAREMNAQLARNFPNRLTESYARKEYVAATNGVTSWGDSAIYPHRLDTVAKSNFHWGPDTYIYAYKGPSGNVYNRISHLALDYKNVGTDKVHFFGQYGILFQDSTFIEQAKLYTKEYIKYTTYPDGTVGEYARNGTNKKAQQGMYYQSRSLQQMIHLADALYRRGDASIYQFDTDSGQHGTRVTSGPKKSLWTVIKRYAENIKYGTDTLYWKDINNDNRIGLIEYKKAKSATDRQAVWDQMLALANRYYDSTLLKGVYTRDLAREGYSTVTNGHNTATEGLRMEWGGSSGTLPGTLFMFGAMENGGLAYTSAGACPSRPQSVVLTAFTGNTASLRWRKLATAASGYSIRIVRQDGTGSPITASTSASNADTSITVSGLSTSTGYYAFVYAKCSASSISDASLRIGFTTLACGTPQNVVATGLRYQGEKVRVAFDQSTTATSGYRIKLVRQDNPSIIHWDSTATYTANVDTVAGLTPQKIYEVTVYGKCAAGVISPASTMDTARTDTISPLSYSITRSTGSTYTSIFSSGSKVTGSSFPWKTSNQNLTRPIMFSTMSGTPFNFRFQGDTVKGIHISRHGFVVLINSLGDSVTVNGDNASQLVNVAYSLANNLAGNSNTRVVAPLWDFVTFFTPNTVNATMAYLLSGSAPNRVLTVEWKGMGRAQSFRSLVNFQLKLYEGSSNIEFVYGDMRFNKFYDVTNPTGDAYSNSIAITYSTGISGRYLNDPKHSGMPLPGQVIALQRENANCFTEEWSWYTDLGANALAALPDSASSYLFTYGGKTDVGCKPWENKTCANDEIANAVTLTPYSAIRTTKVTGHVFSSRFATQSTGTGLRKTVLSGTADDDVWFKFVANATKLNVQIVSSGFSRMVAQVFRTSTDTLIDSAATAATYGKMIDLGLTSLRVGATYYVRVFHYAGGDTATTSVSINKTTVNSVSVSTGGSQYNNAITPRMYFVGDNLGQKALYRVSINGTTGALTSFTKVSGGYGFDSTKTYKLIIERPGYGYDGMFSIQVYAPPAGARIGYDEASDIVLAPNPTPNKTFTVTFSNPDEKLNSVTVFDLTGRKVFTAAGSQREVALGNLARGTYRVLVRSSNKAYNKVLVVE